MIQLLRFLIAPISLSFLVACTFAVKAAAGEPEAPSKNHISAAPKLEADQLSVRRDAWLAKECRMIDRLEAAPEEAIAELKAHIKERRGKDCRSPSFSNSLNIIGYQLTVIGRYADAEPFLKEAVAVRERDGEAGEALLGQSYSNLALVFIEQGRIKEAEPLIVKALKLRAKDAKDLSAVAKSRIVYARMFVAKGDLPGAEAQLKEVLRGFLTPEEKPEEVPIVTFLGLCAQGIANKGLSQKSLEKAGNEMMAETTAHRASAYFRLKALIELAAVFIAEGKYDLARRMLDVALDKTPKYSIYSTDDLSLEKLEPRAYEKLGLLALAQGNFVDAQKHLENAESLAGTLHAAPPVYLDIYTALGELNQHLGKKEEAEGYYHRAADLCRDMLGPGSQRVKELLRLSGSRIKCQ